MIEDFSSLISGACSCPCWCHRSLWCDCPCPEHWSGSWEDLFLPGSGYHNQDLQRNHWNLGKPYFKKANIWAQTVWVSCLWLRPLLPQSDVGLIKTGDKVGASEATLLNMLNISPFSYGLLIQQVYDNGSVYSPEVLDITEASLHGRFLEVSSAAFTASQTISIMWQWHNWLLVITGCEEHC